ncbi:MAG: glycosyltransferase family 9 protein, partial [Alphaproteobacteria bacterium]|nr:glycosyltransferase family 9 protein [Alphaproteobacteria bacterium]
ARFARAYDLQRKDRTALLYRMLSLGRRIEWSGTACGASHRVADPKGDRRHATEKFAAQLAAAGIPSVPRSDLRFLAGDATRYRVPSRAAILVPGASPSRPLKRWPAAAFGAVAAQLQALGIVSVVVGTAQERDAARAIVAACPGTIDLVGQTSIAELATLCRGAVVTIGNDTGPMHLAALVGCPVVVLYASDSDPAMTAPLGPSVSILQRERMAEIAPEDVIAAVRPIIPPPASP